MENKTGRLKLNKKTLVLVISLTLALLISLGTVTYAIFTNSNYAQRTIAPYESVVGDAFSSNNLLKGSSKNNVKTVFVTDPLATPSIHVTVCNYDQGKQSAPNGKDIYYKVTLRLVKLDGGEYVPVNESYITGLNSDDGTTYSVTVTKGVNTVTLNASKRSDTSFTSSLARGVAHSDSYSVVFNGGFVENQPNLYLEMVVTPYTDSSYNVLDETLPVLSGIFKTGMGAQTSWVGEFSDDTRTAPRNYDGFNYVVSGTGSGTFTLKWNNEKVALSYESIRELGVTVSTSGSTSTIQFDVDSDTKSMYEIQFYKVNITSETWLSSMNANLASAGSALTTTVVGYFFSE